MIDILSNIFYNIDIVRQIYFFTDTNDFLDINKQLILLTTTNQKSVKIHKKKVNV